VPLAPNGAQTELAMRSCECISSKTYADICGSIGSNVKWKLKIPHTLSLEQYTKICSPSDRQGIVQVLPLIDGSMDTIFYDACVGNLYSAVKRQCIEVTQPSKIMLSVFFEWFENLFDEEIVPILSGFDYCADAWYNGLTASQQLEIDKVKCFELAGTSEEHRLQKRVYSMFCKREKQLVDDDKKNPKNRCICAPNAEYKFVMGPVVARLDLLFRKFKGYCAGKNWTEMEKTYNTRYANGLSKTIEGDGSGFDRTQTHELKAVERKIYQYLADNGLIHHVSNETFLYHVNQEWHNIYVTHNYKEGKLFCANDLGYVSVRGTVLSGSMDTTFANTLRMALYNRFVAEAYLKLSPDEYDIDAKGDDFALFVSPMISDDAIKSAYYSVFSKNKTGIFGLGQILKFLKIGTIDTLDFCSTEVFWSNKLKSFKIVRQLGRFMQLSGWSHTVLSLSLKERKQYLHALYESNLHWMKGLPIFEEYNNLMKMNFFFAASAKAGPKKKIRPTLKQHLHKVVDGHALTLKSYSADDYYANLDRISDKTGCREDYLLHLQKHYNLWPKEVEQICNSISNAKDGSQMIYSTALIDAFEYKRNISNVVCEY